MHRSCKNFSMISTVIYQYKTDTVVTQCRTSSPEAEGQSDWVTRVCTRCNPRLAAHCSSELQFLRSLSLLIVCAMRGAVLIGARIFTVVVRSYASSKRDSRWGSIREHAYTSARARYGRMRLVPKGPAGLPSDYYYVGPNRNRISFIFLFYRDVHGKKGSQIKITQFHNVNVHRTVILANWRLSSKNPTKMEVRAKDLRIRKFWNSDTWIGVEGS